MMTNEQANAVAELLECFEAHENEMPEAFFAELAGEACKGDLFDFAVNYLMECNLVRPTIIRASGRFLPALVAS